MNLSFEMVFLDRAMDIAGICDAALKLVASAGLGEERYEVAGRRGTLAVDLVAVMLRAMNSTSFWLDGKKLALQTRPGIGKTKWFGVDFKTSAPPRETFEQWVAVLAPWGNALYARLYDSEWERWQNEKQLSTFALFERSTTGLKTTWDPDFEEEIVDTSCNPGRVVNREIYREALGHEMWLMPAFWATTRAQRTKVAATLPCRELEGALAVTLAATPFDDERFPSEAVRRLLFP